MTAVNALRERHKDRIEKEQGVKLSLMPFFDAGPSAPRMPITL